MTDPSSQESARLAPLPRWREAVRPEWIDYNGHMNVAYYVLVFDHATDAALASVGLGPDYAAGGTASVFAVEAHVTYDREVGEGDPLDVSTQVLGVDDKRVHLFHTMVHADRGFPAATNEVLLLHVDLKVRRATPFPDAARRALERLAAAHADRPRPAKAGRAVALNPKGPVEGGA